MTSRAIRTTASTSIASRTAILGALALVGSFHLASCAIWSSPVPPGKKATDVVSSSDPADDRITIEPDRSPGEPDRTRPIIYPPRVLAVWISEHVDAERDMKVGDHWVYLKLRDSSWFEEAIDREPAVESAAAGELGGDELRRILPRDSLKKMILPWKEDAGGADSAKTDIEGDE